MKKIRKVKMRIKDVHVQYRPPCKSRAEKKNGTKINQSESVTIESVGEKTSESGCHLGVFKNESEFVWMSQQSNMRAFAEEE